MSTTTIEVNFLTIAVLAVYLGAIWLINRQTDHCADQAIKDDPPLWWKLELTKARCRAELVPQQKEEAKQ